MIMKLQLAVQGNLCVDIYITEHRIYSFPRLLFPAVNDRDIRIPHGRRIVISIKRHGTGCPCLQIQRHHLVLNAAV